MNSVQLIGRLTRDPEAKYTSGTDPMCILNFTLAINRPQKRGRQKDEKGEVDFVRCIVFGKPAESCLRFIHKGSKVAISGRIQSGSYKNKNGDTVFTTDVVCNAVEFLTYDEPKQGGGNGHSNNNGYSQNGYDPQDMFETADTDVPF